MQSGRTGYRSVIWEITQKKDRKSRKLFLMRSVSKTDTGFRKIKAIQIIRGAGIHLQAGISVRMWAQKKRHFRKIAKTEFLMKNFERLLPVREPKPGRAGKWQKWHCMRSGDRAPEISAPDKEYFEGETVKRRIC